MKRLLLVLVLFGLAAVPAVGLDVFIDHPTGLDFVFGVVDFVVTVVSEEQVTGVELHLDGRRLGELVQAPYRVRVHVGDDNLEHEFRVVARTLSGETATATVVTPKLKVDDVVDLDLQQLYVTATNSNYRVLDLGRDDFRVTDNGKKQKIVTFERGDIPLTAVLLLDCSLSMKGDRLGAALAGAEAFVDGMQELDEAMVMLFSDRLLRRTEFSNAREQLGEALENVEAVGGTAINDHLFMALSQLEARQGRRVVVLFSDGADVHSALAMDEVLRKARMSRALIYWIYLPEVGEEDEIPAYSSAWRNVEANQVEFRGLRQSVRESGGRIQFLESVDGIGAAFEEILTELREQYVLGYYPTIARRDGSWHNVKVKVIRAGIGVRTRDGYLDF